MKYSATLTLAFISAILFFTSCFKEFDEVVPVDNETFVTNIFGIVTDQNGNCAVLSEPVPIIEPELLVATVIDSLLPTCYGRSDGKIVIQHEGGTGTFHYDPALGTQFDESTMTWSGLGQGLYDLRIEDENGSNDEGNTQLVDNSYFDEENLYATIEDIEDE